MNAIFHLAKQNSIGNHFLAELRDVNIQQDSLRFRKNLERLSELLGYELSRTLEYTPLSVETPLGVAETQVLTQLPVLATILRAGLPMHQGLLNLFDRAGNAFVSAYRRHHKDGSFEINVEYVSCPNIEDRPLIISDPMLATGYSMEKAVKALIQQGGQPSSIHIVVAIAAVDGIQHIQRHIPQAKLWIGDIDEELTAKSYIVPGLGDAGDLAFGSKMQE
jgi:uracil phosphoribosyltransferase